MLQGSNVGDNDCKGFDERILHWFSWHDIVPFEPSERLAQHGHAGQLAAVIADIILGNPIFILVLMGRKPMNNSLPSLLVDRSVWGWNAEDIAHFRACL